MRLIAKSPFLLLASLAAGQSWYDGTSDVPGGTGARLTYAPDLDGFLLWPGFPMRRHLFRERLGSWWPVALSVEPPARDGGAFAYDEARREVVLFGGYAGNGSMFADQWRFDGRTWNVVVPAVVPTARGYAAFVLDLARQRFVLFGGLTAAFTSLQDTWEWDGTTWTQRAPVHSPPSRADAACAYDAARGRTVIHGGRFSGPASLADTWEWDGVDWAQFSGPGPGLRSGAVMAFDAVGQRCVLFGGEDAGANQFADTWTFDGSAWTRLTTATSPPPQSYGAMASDGQSRVLLCEPDASSTWEFDGRDWHHVVNGLPHQYSAAMAFDPTSQRVVLFGGRSLHVAHPLSNEFTTFDGLHWSRVTAPLRPPARYAAAMAADTVRNRLVLFGGQQQNFTQTFLSDTWEWNGTSWSQAVVAGPSARAGHQLAFDLLRGRVVLFGGADNAGLPTDTWEWDGTQWSLVATTPGPTGRINFGLVYDPARGRTIMFGGSDPATWEWNGTAWLQVTPVHSPGARNAPLLVYSPLRARVQVFGGFDPVSANTYLDAYEWDGVDWTAYAPGTQPSAFLLGSIAFDPVRGFLVYRNAGATQLFTAHPSALEPYGAGCSAGAGGEPLLSFGGRPAVGTSALVLWLDRLARGSLCALVYDVQSASLPLGPCTQLVQSPTTFLLALADAAGHCERSLAVPQQPALRGVDVFVQAGTFVPGGPFLGGLALSAALHLHVGD